MSDSTPIVEESPAPPQAAEQDSASEGGLRLPVSLQQEEESPSIDVTIEGYKKLVLKLQVERDELKDQLKTARKEYQDVQDLLTQTNEGSAAFRAKAWKELQELKVALEGEGKKKE